MIVGILVVVILSAIFIGLFLLNKKVPKPEGCEINIKDCHNCNNPLCKINQENR